jgi:hypothetical protein
MPRPSRTKFGFWITTDARGVRRVVRPKEWTSWNTIPEQFVTLSLVWLAFVFTSGVVVVSITRTAMSLRAAPIGPPWFLVAALWLAAVLFSGHRLIRSLRTRAPVIAAIELSNNRCPSCGYDLEAQGPQSDGCTVCPECGGAWQMEHLDN